MTPEQQRIAIAEAWGFEPGTINKDSWLGYCTPLHAETLYQLGCDVEDSDEKPNHILAKVPYFPGNLNAMHEAEEILTEEQWLLYWREAFTIIERDKKRRAKGWDFIHMTAAQHAESFLRALNLWRE